jgi:hypothetical protein
MSQMLYLECWYYVTVFQKMEKKHKWCHLYVVLNDKLCLQAYCMGMLG